MAERHKHHRIKLIDHGLQDAAAHLAQQHLERFERRTGDLLFQPACVSELLLQRGVELRERLVGNACVCARFQLAAVARGWVGEPAPSAAIFKVRLAQLPLHARRRSLVAACHVVDSLMVPNLKLVGSRRHLALHEDPVQLQGLSQRACCRRRAIQVLGGKRRLAEQERCQKLAQQRAGAEDVEPLSFALLAERQVRERASGAVELDVGLVEAFGEPDNLVSQQTGQPASIQRLLARGERRNELAHPRVGVAPDGLADREHVNLVLDLALGPQARQHVVGLEVGVARAKRGGLVGEQQPLGRYRCSILREFERVSDRAQAPRFGIEWCRDPRLQLSHAGIECAFGDDRNVGHHVPRRVVVALVLEANEPAALHRSSKPCAPGVVRTHRLRRVPKLDLLHAFDARKVDSRLMRQVGALANQLGDARRARVELGPHGHRHIAAGVRLWTVNVVSLPESVNDTARAVEGSGIRRRRFPLGAPSVSSTVPSIYAIPFAALSDAATAHAAHRL